jgi:Ca2+-binding EF-hand superfamily protein
MVVKSRFSRSLAMVRFALAVFAIATVLAPLPLLADVIDAVKDAVDPFNPGAERGRFLVAAGVDSEMDEAEFKANAAAADPFVRKFDSWAAMKAFDRNGNGTIDWFEAESYRKALREATVKVYDKNHDGQLDEAERAAAASDLAAGKAPRIAAGGGGSDWDKNGNGRVDPDEVEAYSKAQQQRYAQWQAEYTKRWDKDGDGKVSAEEAAAAQKAQMQEWRDANPQQAAFHDLYFDLLKKKREEQTKKYDLNGNGRLDADEWKALSDDRMKAWKERDPQGHANWVKQQEQMQASWRKQQEEQLKKYDANGNGKLDPDEWRAVGEDQNRQWKQQQADQLKKYDANGDGKLDADEWKAIGEDRMNEWREQNPEAAAAYEKQQARWKQQQADYLKKWDADGDGKLSHEENEAAWKARREQLEKEGLPEDGGWWGGYGYGGFGGYGGGAAAPGPVQVSPGGNGGQGGPEGRVRSIRLQEEQ